MIPKKDIEVLTSLGLTSLQAKVYLASVSLEEANVQRISESIHVARQQIYVVVKELEKMGLVERILGKSLKLNSTPLEDVLSILLRCKYEDRGEAERKALNLIKRYEHTNKVRARIVERKSAFLLIPEREALSLRLKRSIDFVQRTIDIWLPKKTCLQAFFRLTTSFMKALERGVEIRCVIDEQIHVKLIPKPVRKIIENPNFKLKIVSAPCTETFGIYDREIVIVGCEPRQDYVRTSALWTNNGPLVRIIQNYFDNMWNGNSPLNAFALSEAFSLRK